MNKLLVLFCVIVLSKAVLGQTTEFESKFVLDPFTFPSSALFIITGEVDGGNNARDQISESNLDSSIIGGERDLNLRVLFSEANLVLSTNVNSGLFSASTPNGPTGNALLQLDGIDNSTAINRQGLNQLPESNFLGLGATEFRYTATSDHPTDVVLKVYQRFEGVDYICQKINTIPENTLTTVRIPFDEFIVPSTGAPCDISFTKIGAIEISIVMKIAVDINIRDFELWGPVVTCNCFCPTYTCRILLDEDDDEYFFYRSSDFNNDNVISNPTTDFSTVNVGTTRSATPTTGLTPTRSPIVDPGTSGSPNTVSNGSPSTIVIISGGNDDSSASVLALAGALIFLVVAMF